MNNVQEEDKEIWKTIEDFPDYMVSNWGNVKSCKFNKERILKPQNNGHGYLIVQLCKNSKIKSMKIHKLVANAFIDNSDKLSQVNHIDECKTNNNVSNLEFCSAKYNINYGNRTKRAVEKLSKSVGQFAKDGTLIKVWSSTRECEKNGFQHGNISSCCNGRYKTHKGFKWRYIEN